MNVARGWTFIGLALGLALVVGGTPGPALALFEEEPEGHRGFMAAKGRVTYRVYCSNCHGAQAKGNGNLAQFLTVQPSDLTRLAATHDGEFPTEAVTVAIDGTKKVRGHGAQEMPVWGDVFQHSLAEPTTADESAQSRARRKITELVLYLQTIQVVEEGVEAPGD